MENPLSLYINGIIFTLIEKTVLSDGYIIVRIQSNLNGSLANFWVYRSNSELGFWRLCSSVEGNPTRLYKGDPDEFNYDYIQTTFIHLLLQFFINTHFGAISPIPYLNTQGIKYTDKNKRIADRDSIKKHNLFPYYDKTEKKIFVLSNPLTPAYKAIVDDNNRIIQEHPFIDMYHEAKCGEQLNIETLQEFSANFQRDYTVDPDIPVSRGNYKYIFEEIMDVEGEINCITLRRNIHHTNPLINNIELYYLNAHLCGLQNTSEFHENIEYVCSEDKHIMPFLLIPVDTPVNILGLYSKYILAGAYVCKLFDYAVQCSPKENKRRQCTINYTHIGYRYNELFPFIEQIEQIEQIGKRRKGPDGRGTKKSKRKTRKQQKKEIDKKEKRKERNKGKERRSKNKNKSKKYGARSM